MVHINHPLAKYFLRLIREDPLVDELTDVEQDNMRQHMLQRMKSSRPKIPQLLKRTKPAAAGGAGLLGTTLSSSADPAANGFDDGWNTGEVRHWTPMLLVPGFDSWCPFNCCCAHALCSNLHDASSASRLDTVMHSVARGNV